MAHYLHSSLFRATVYKWEHPSGQRVTDTTNGKTFLLNVNSITGIIDKSVEQTGKASLYYYDNPWDRRDNGHYMLIGKSAAELIAYMDTTMTHEFATLPVYPNDDITASTVNHTFKHQDIAFGFDVTQGSDTHTWLYVRSNEAFKVLRYLIDLSTTEILALFA